MKLPDIENGYAVINTEENAIDGWRTEIAAVLENKTQDTRAYLTSRCLAENLSDAKIFPAYAYEYCVVKTWRGNFILRAGPYLYGLNGASGISDYEPFPGKVSIVCPSAEYVEHDSESLAAQFSEGEGKLPGRLFMQVSYKFAGEDYEITAPAKYVNFQAPAVGGFWLQPIVGYVLFLNSGRFAAAYIAAHINKSGAHIEISARKKVPFMELKPKTGRLYKALRIFRPVLDRLFVTDDFCDVYAVPGSVRFFTYQRQFDDRASSAP